MASLGATVFALAATAQRVALVRPVENDQVLVETFNRLTAELHLQDFQVTLVDGPLDAHMPETLEAVARRVGALASVGLLRHEGRTAVDIWLDDRSGGRPVVRRLEPSGGAELTNVLAIRAVDLLRVNLREPAGERTQELVRIDRGPPADSVAPPVPTPVVRRWEIRAEGLMLFDGANLGAAFGPALGFAGHVSAPLRIGILLSGPLIGANWETPFGSASLRQQMGLAEIRASWWRSRRLDFGVSLAGGVHHMMAQGTAKPPLGSQADQVWSLAGALGADGSFRLTSNAGIALTVRAIALSPKPGVGVGTETTVLQLPLLSASAGLLVGF
jgi:hypothetical protein